MTICNHPGCSRSRWRGPSGTNSRLTFCEEHQRAYWRDRKAAKRPASTPRPRKPRSARKPKADKRCKKTITVDYKRGVFREQQVVKLDTIKQLEIVLALYRQAGYKVVEK